MADEKEFAKELNALIKRYIDGGCDPEDIADELAREANYVFGHRQRLNPKQASNFRLTRIPLSAISCLARSSCAASHSTSALGTEFADGAALVA